MPSLSENASVQGFEEFIKLVYVLPNDRNYDLAEMLCNIQRFAMRGIKGIRKGDVEKIKKNLIISLSWFNSTLVRLHINLEDALWERFPCHCSYCAGLPCSCRKDKVQSRQAAPIDPAKKPKTISDYQKMFEAIYPASSRTIEDAGIHFAEEVGEFSEALLAYRGERLEEDFRKVNEEAADYFSCVLGIFNSLKIDLASELAGMFSEGCHVCHKAPCQCSYEFVKSYK